MDKQINLYLVQSPLQAINAYEFRRSQTGENELNVIVVLDQSWQPNNAMVATTLAALDWKPDFVLPHGASSVGKVLAWMRLRRFVRSLSSVRRVVIGAYDSGLMVAAANLLKKAQVFIVDDGTQSLVFPDYRYLGARGEHHSQDRHVDWLGFDSRLPQGVTFFSIYELPLRAPDCRTKNELSFLKTGIRYDDSGPVFFAGSIFADMGLVTQDTYIDWVAAVRRWFGGREMHYFPHRRTNLEVKRKALESLGVRIVQLDFPFELHLARSGAAPCAVAGLYTTIFDTLLAAGLCEPQRLMAFVVPEDIIIDPMERRMARTCYQSYQKAGMRVIDALPRFTSELQR
jgi:hypothetical protein